MVVRTLLRRVPGRMAECSESIPRPDDYTTVNGFRFVKPYHFDFACSVKERWAGQTLLEVFSREFPARPRSYYVRAIAEGRLRLESGGAKKKSAPAAPAPLSPDTILRPGQRMRHLIHRHEPPVLGGSVPILGETEEIIAAGKPAGMPVHVSGQYRKNTVLGVLQAERPELGNLLPVHRLDKPVSGVLLFARSAAAADALRRRIEAHDVEKVYVARVQGRFPETPVPLVVTVPLAWDQQHNHVLACPGAVVVDEEGAASKDDEGDSSSGEAQQDRTAPHQEIGEGESATSVLTQSSSSAKHSFRAQRRERALAKRAKQEAQRAERAARMKSGSQLHPPKSAKTEFRLLSVAPDGKTSLVECRPRTGRTHQIRVHLQYLGHPIANDGQYGGSYGGPLASRLLAQALGVAWDQMRKAAGLPVWGEVSVTKATTGNEQQHILQPDDGAAERELPITEPPALKRLKAELNDECGGADEVRTTREGQVSTLDPQRQSAYPSPVIQNRDADTYAQNQAFRSDDAYRVPEHLLDSDCPHCPFLTPVDYPLDLRPLWLHARSYSCSQWAFQAPLPDWAEEDFVAPLDGKRMCYS